MVLRQHFYDKDEHVLSVNIDDVHNNRIGLNPALELGVYDMRVQLSNRIDVEPCGYFDEGEVEDYHLKLIEDPGNDNNSLIAAPSTPSTTRRHSTLLA